ncbi:flagellar hook-length control protein [Salmonella enterica subsp. enterica serovar Typhi]|nr:flagellar hook-length control protein [Salmonella enterica subsp. enterica serovar Typhi]
MITLPQLITTDTDMTAGLTSGKISSAVARASSDVGARRRPQ